MFPQGRHEEVWIADVRDTAVDEDVRFGSRFFSGVWRCFGRRFRRSSSVLRVCGFDRTISKGVFPFNVGAGDRKRRDGFHIPKWKGFMADQVRLKEWYCGFCSQHHVW